MLQVSSRVLDQYDILLHFVKHADDKSNRFKRISAALENPLLLPTLQFLKFVMGKLDLFEKKFQTDEIMIHSLFVELRRLLLTIMGLCVRETVINKREPWKTDFKSDVNKLSAKDLIFADDARKVVETLSERNQIIIFTDVVRPFFEYLLEKMLEHLPFQNKVLKYLRFVDPTTLLSKEIIQNVVGFAKVLPNTIFPSDRTEELKSELRTLRLTNQSSPSSNVSISENWSTLLSTNKCENFRNILTAALCLPHGNPVAERQFSSMGNILTENRNSLSDDTLSSLLFLRNTIANFGGVSCIDVTPNMRLWCRNAHARYTDVMRERRRQAENHDMEVMESDLKNRLEGM